MTQISVTKGQSFIAYTIKIPREFPLLLLFVSVFTSTECAIPSTGRLCTDAFDGPVSILWVLYTLGALAAPTSRAVSRPEALNLCSRESPDDFIKMQIPGWYLG